MKVETYAGGSTAALAGARWMWGGADPRPLNGWRMFRRVFTLDRAPTRMTLSMFAEARYKVWINGRRVGIGPGLCFPDHRLIDRYRVDEHLTKGMNVLACLVHCPGIMTGQWTLTNAALLCDLRSENAAVPVVTGDSEWRTAAAVAWRNPAELCPYGKGFSEVCDATLEPPGWREPDFDEQGWDGARVLEVVAGGSPEQLNVRYVPLPVFIPRVPKRVVARGEISRLPGEQDPPAAAVGAAASTYAWTRNRWRRQMGLWHDGRDMSLPAGEPMPAPTSAMGNHEVYQLLADEALSRGSEGETFPIRISAAVEDRTPFVVLDMGVVRSGMLTFALTSRSGGTVDVGYDDRLTPAGNVNPARTTTSCERVVVPGGRFSWEGFFERGGRYIQLVFRHFEGEITLEQAGITETLGIPADLPAAKFAASDGLLTRIWQASAETARLYLNDCGAGDPYRERIHWSGDDWMSLRMAWWCFGQSLQWRRGLELTAQSQNSDGSFPVISPGHFEDYNMNSGIWITSLEEYCRETGDRDFGREHLPKVGRWIEYESRFANGDGLLYETPGRRFISWAEGIPRRWYEPGEMWRRGERTVGWGDFFDPPTLGFNAIINANWLWALRQAAALADLLGAKDLRDRWRSLHDRASAAFEAMFWDGGMSLYRDNVAFGWNGEKSAPTYSEPTLFALIRAGVVSGRKALECYDRVRVNGFECVRSTAGLEYGAVPLLLLKQGRTAEALALYRDRWGSPVEAGATTMGEEFFRTGANSDCHIHGAAPARDFLEYLAGVRLAGAGWSQVIFAPPADAPELSCEIPTPRGFLKVQISRSKDGLRYGYELPEGCTASYEDRGVLRALKGRVGSFLV